MEPITCPVCGVYLIDGTFRFSYQPTKPISADDVAGLVCTNLSKNPKGELLKSQCINKTGDATNAESWEKRLKSI